MACFSGNIEVIQKRFKAVPTPAHKTRPKKRLHDAYRHQHENIVVGIISIPRYSAVSRHVLRVSVSSALEPHAHRLRLASAFIEAGFLPNLFRGWVGRGWAGRRLCGCWPINRKFVNPFSFRLTLSLQSNPLMYVIVTVSVAPHASIALGL